MGRFDGLWEYVVNGMSHGPLRDALLALREEMENRYAGAWGESQAPSAREDMEFFMDNETDIALHDAEWAEDPEATFEPLDLVEMYDEAAQERAELLRRGRRLSRWVLARDIACETMGLYPKSVTGGDGAYEARSEWMEGWNAALMTLQHRFLGLACGGDVARDFAEIVGLDLDPDSRRIAPAEFLWE